MGKVKLAFPFLLMLFLVLASGYSWLAGWKYRRPIIVYENSGKNLTDYQVPIELNSSNFNFSKANADGSDIRFTDINDTLLAYWIENWNSTAQEAKVWVKVPSIPAFKNTTFFMYYGNMTITTSKSNYTSTMIVPPFFVWNRTGKEIGSTVGGLIVDEDYLYYIFQSPTGRGEIEKRFKSNGTLVWDVIDTEIAYYTGPSDSDDFFLYLSGRTVSGHSFAEKRFKSNGTLVWRQLFEPYAGNGIAVDDQYVYLIIYNDSFTSIYKLYKTNGSIVWRVEDSLIYGGKITIDNKYLYHCIRDSIGRYYVQKRFKSNGTLIWKVGTNSLSCYWLDNYGEYIYVGTSNGLSKLSKSDGSLIWNTIDGKVLGIDIDPNRKMIYASTTGGWKIYKVRDQDGTIVWELPVKSDDSSSGGLITIYTNTSYPEIYSAGAKYNTSSSTHLTYFSCKLSERKLTEPEPTIEVKNETMLNAKLDVDILYPETRTYTIENITTNISLSWYCYPDEDPTNYSITIYLNDNKTAELNGTIESNQTLYFSVPLDIYENTFNLLIIANATNFYYNDNDTLTFEIKFYNLELLQPNKTAYYNTVPLQLNVTCYRQNKNITLQLWDNGSNTENYTYTCQGGSSIVSWNYQSPHEHQTNLTILLLPYDPRENSYNVTYSYYSDLYPPAIIIGHTINWHINQQEHANFTFHIFDSASPNITCNFTIWTEKENGTYENNSYIYRYLPLKTVDSVFLFGECVDLAGNYNSSELKFQLFHRCFQLANEKTGANYTPSNETVNITATLVGTGVTKPITTDFFCVNTNSTDYIKLDLDYGNGLLVTRYFGLDVVPSDHTKVCAGDPTTFYEHHAISSEVVPVYIYNPTTGCYILADKTRFSEQSYYTTRAYAIDANYYIYILRNGQKIYLASLDGSQPSTINLDVLEYRAEGGFTMPSAERIIAISKVEDTTLHIYYKNPDGDNTKLTIRIKDLSDNEVFFEHTEEDNPNEVTVYFDFATLNITANPILKVEFIEYKSDGTEQIYYRYFNLEGKTGKLHPYFAIFVSIATLIFGITLVANNVAFGWLGIMLSIVSLGLLAFSIADWKIIFIEAALSVVSLYIFLASLSRQAKALI